MITAKIVLLGDSAVGKSSLAARFVKDEFVPHQESTIGAAFMSHLVFVPSTSQKRPASADETSGGCNFSNDCTKVKLEIWDTAGQERYRSLAPMYYRGAVGAVIVYDVTCAASLKRAKAWISELIKVNGGGSKKNHKHDDSTDDGILIALVGNKVDLVVDDHDESQTSAAEDRKPRAVSAQEALAALLELTQYRLPSSVPNTDADGISLKSLHDSFDSEKGNDNTKIDNNRVLFFETSAKTGHNVTAVFNTMAAAVVAAGVGVSGDSGQTPSSIRMSRKPLNSKVSDEAEVASGRTKSSCTSC